MKGSQLMIRADIKARWVVQRESYLHEEIRALRKTSSLQPLVPHPHLHVLSPLTAEEKPQLSAYEAQLRHLDTQYTEHKRYMWFLEGGKPLSALGRAFETCRKNPNWYLSKWLRRDCAGRGGCCGRSCECCGRSREIVRWEWRRGGCTSACGCCVRAHAVSGVEGKGNRKVDDYLEMPASITGSCKTMYNVRMHFAYIWGFDLLDDVNGR
ncbi:uncharacterized protein ASPGLDRAFT_43944 [Aspergillus glaucus CBS 516.65]|uniref:Uncharacterized protein n=1 Tax=Aspergillus glaucus CBS 516.65 TaxID=1160497 RepID=A0A1L9VU12_ASPGL|nr:hypothetical protein ASPGLDRAFT_43944 [Aspergillus glaucus CBS 516.65]OJJ87389.1 hypothetical protein ASPGLDRAFT_43944 [Aspergillus glaucus CBS 516.65]